MPIEPAVQVEAEGAFEVVHATLSERALAQAFSLARRWFVMEGGCVRMFGAQYVAQWWSVGSILVRVFVFSALRREKHG